MSITFFRAAGMLACLALCTASASHRRRQTQLAMIQYARQLIKRDSAEANSQSSRKRRGCRQSGPDDRGNAGLMQ